MTSCKRRVARWGTVALGLNFVAGLVALRWVKPLFPGDPVEYLFGFMVALMGVYSVVEVWKMGCFTESHNPREGDA